MFVSTAVINSISSILGLLINVSFIGIIFTDQKQQTSDILMACLSAGDLVVNVVAQPLFILVRMNDIMEPDIVHIPKFTKVSIYSMTIGMALILLTILNVDRAVACTFPFFHKIHFTRKRLLLAVAVTVGAVPVWLWTRITINSRQFAGPGVFIGLSLCLTIIFTSCFLMIKSIRKSNRVLAEGNHLQLIRQRLLHKRVAKTVLLIVALQFVLYLPLALILTNKSLIAFWPLAVTMAFSNSCLNSALYISRSAMVLQRYSKLLRRLLRSHRVTPLAQWPDWQQFPQLAVCKRFKLRSSHFSIYEQPIHSFFIRTNQVISTSWSGWLFLNVLEFLGSWDVLNLFLILFFYKALFWHRVVFISYQH